MINLENQLYNRANPQASAVLAMLSHYDIPETDRYPAGDQLDCAPFINGRERGYLLFDWRTGLNVVVFEARSTDDILIGYCSRSPDSHESAMTKDQFMDHWDTQIQSDDIYSMFRSFQYGEVSEAAAHIHNLFDSELGSIDPDDFLAAMIATCSGGQS